MGKSKRQRGLCDVLKCYNKATVVWETPMGSIIRVCAEHDRMAQDQMPPDQYKKMKPKPLEEN